MHHRPPSKAARPLASVEPPVAEATPNPKYLPPQSNDPHGATLSFHRLPAPSGVAPDQGKEGGSRSLTLPTSSAASRVGQQPVNVHRAILEHLVAALHLLDGTAMLDIAFTEAAVSVAPPGQAEPRRMKLVRFAERHDVSLSTVKKWVRLGLPTNGIVGRGVRVKVEEGDRWVDSGGPVLALRTRGAARAQRS